MSSDKQLSPGEYSNWDGSVSENTQNQEQKVCFICGNHTTLIINIHEPRCGPNMIDVISEKFKMRPLHDDKYLCYNCNNWLINWYTVQKKNNDSSHEDSQTTSSTMSAAITTNAREQTATKTSDDPKRCGPNELIVVSDDDDEMEHDENVDVNNVIQTLRNRLKKYLYYPNRNQREKANDLDEFYAYPQSTTVIELNASPDIRKNCEGCGKLIKKHLNRRRQRTFCRSCRFSLRRIEKLKAHHKISTYHLTRSQRKTLISMSPHKQLETSALSNRTNIFKKLQQLGTSIYYENEYKEMQQELNRHMTSIPHEIDTNRAYTKQSTNAWTQPTANESNEILMTFNTVLTEVFPIEQLYNCDRTHAQIQHSTQTDFNIQDILRNVPKSLTITIA